MLKAMNAKLAGEPAWKLWILHHAARLLRVPIKVRSIPYGAATTPGVQMQPEQTERVLKLAEGLLQGTGAGTLSEALSKSDRRCVSQRPTGPQEPEDSTR